MYDVYDPYDLYDLHDLPHVAGSELYNLHHLRGTFPGLHVYYNRPVQHLITADEDLDDMLIEDLHDVSVRRVNNLIKSSGGRVKK